MALTRNQSGSRQFLTFSSLDYHLSGAAIISQKTDAASPDRCADSLSPADNVVWMAKPATIANLISCCLFCRRYPLHLLC